MMDFITKTKLLNHNIKYMYNTLKQLGIIERKTFNASVPKIYFDTHKHMFRHFLRGVIDGDGNVDKSSGTDIRICSASNKFLRELKKLLEENNIQTGEKLLTHSYNKNTHYLRFSGANKKVKNFLYKDAENFLKYKKERIFGNNITEKVK